MRRKKRQEEKRTGRKRRGERGVDKEVEDGKREGERGEEDEDKKRARGRIWRDSSGEGFPEERRRETKEREEERE